MSSLIVKPSNQVNFDNAFRPIKAKKAVSQSDALTWVNRDGTVQMRKSANTPFVNSALRKDEWEMLDEIVVEAASPRTAILSRLPVFTHTSIGVLAHQYNVSSQMTEASVSLDGQRPADEDSVDFNLKTVPLPMIYKDFRIGARTLEASRMTGTSVDTTSAFEATRVVVEKLASMLYAGDTTINLNGQTIYGLTSHPNRNTGSAAGDFGTIANIKTTIISMINALTADNFFGPYELDIAATQYNECLEHYTDGSGQTALQRILDIPQIQVVNPSDQLTAGSLVLRQAERRTVEWVQTSLGGQGVNGIQVALVEWVSGNGMAHNFCVMAIAAPAVKADHAGNSGVAHYTGA